MKSLFTLLAVWIGIAALAHDHQSKLEFIENKTQWNENVLYKCALSAGAAFLEADGITYSFYNPEDYAQLHDLQQASRAEQDAFIMHGHAWKLHFLGALSPSHEGKLKLETYQNYFIGNDPSKWSSHVGLFHQVSYQSLYEGVDVRFHSREQNFKYDFIVQPGADYSQIRLGFSGLDGIELKDGALIYQTSVGEFIESEPYAFQLIDGKLEEVACAFVLENGEVSFSIVNGYNPNYELVIDPELIAATLSGSTGFESNYGHSAAYDIEGNIYTGCVAGGSGYPSTEGAFQQAYGGGGWDMGISKLSPDGSELIWATLIGGSNSEYPHSMIANDAQELYVYGSTRSSNYPTTGGAVQTTLGGMSDIVVTHLSEDGTALLGSTFLGGSADDGQNTNSSNYGDTYRGEIILGYDNLPMIASCSQSSDFPILGNAFQSTLSGDQDAVLLKLNENLSSLVISTFLGSPTNDMGYGIREGLDGTIYVCGSAGDNFPTTPGAYQTAFLGSDDPWGAALDGFIARFNSDGSDLVECTYHGTESSDQVFFIDLDFDENVWVFGQGGSDMPVVGDVYVNDDARQFITKFDRNLSSVLIGTTIGDSNDGTDMVPDAFLVDNCDNIYISSYNAYGAFETTEDALFDEGGFYLAVFEADLVDIIFGTFYTGNHVDGGTSRFDKNGIVYQAVCSGGGFSTTADAWATDQGAGWDIGVFKINFDASGVNAAVAANDFSGCAPYEITFENYSVGDQFDWDFGDGNGSDEYAPTHIFTEPGVYDVSLIASDSLSCNLADTSLFQVVISTPQDFSPSFDFDFDCVSQSIELTNTTGIEFLTYVWDMGDGTTVEEFNANHTYESPGDYTVTLLAIDEGCDDDEEISQLVTLAPSVEALIETNGTEACEELEAIFTNASVNGVSYFWEFGDGNTSTEAEPTYTFIGPASYDVILTATNNATCNGESSDTLTINVGANQVITPLFDIIQTDCEIFTVETSNESEGINVVYSWDMGDGTLLEGQEISHNYAGAGSYDVTLTVSDPFCDLSEAATVPVEITTEVVATISNGDVLDCFPAAIDFESNSNGLITWDFGDGSPTQTGGEVTHSYSVAGNYTVTMTVVGENGCVGEDETTSLVELVEPPVLEPSFDFVQSGECIDLNLALNNTSEGPIDNFAWNLGDGTTSNDVALDHTYSQPGSYTVTLAVTNDICSVQELITETITISDGSDYDLPPDASLCYNLPFTTLDAGIPNAQYEWSTGEDTQAIAVDSPGLYEVQINSDGCWYGDFIEVIEIEALTLSSTYSECKGNNVLVIPYATGSNYLWEHGPDGPTTLVEESGVYPFSLTDENGCYQEGVVDIEIESNEPIVFIPNSFTPNGDGVNDVFHPVTRNLDEYEFMVFNRWGEVVFETQDPEEVWVGEVQNEEYYYVIDGVYSFKINYRSKCNSERIEQTGVINVIR